jgi:glutaryl-CoA dehydrogenase
MIADLQLAGYSEKTQQSYLMAVRGLAKHYMRSPDQLSQEEVRQPNLRNARDNQEYAATTSPLASARFGAILSSIPAPGGAAMPAPPDTDFLQLDELLTDAERSVREKVRAFVDREVLPVIADCFEQGRFPRELVPEIARMGVLGMKLEGYGKSGSVAFGLACRELERGDSALRSFLSVTSSLVMYPIFTFGSEEQKARWLPLLSRGKAIGCFALTEPEAGSDAASIRTVARRDGVDWRLTGVKRWISYGELADVALVWAQTEEGMRGFLVEKGTPGFSARPIPHLGSLRASVTSTLILEEVRVPDAARLPGAVGLKGPLACINEGRLGIAWGALGAAAACFEAARAYAGKRVQFGRPIAAFQLTQQKLARMLAELAKGELLAWRVARLRDEGRARPEQISLAKMNNVAAALAIAREARSVLGGNGISLDFHVMRHLANLESVYTYEGTHEIHTLILGEAVTGIPAFGG